MTDLILGASQPLGGDGHNLHSRGSLRTEGCLPAPARVHSSQVSGTASTLFPVNRHIGVDACELLPGEAGVLTTLRFSSRFQRLACSRSHGKKMLSPEQGWER